MREVEGTSIHRIDDEGLSLPRPAWPGLGYWLVYCSVWSDVVWSIRFFVASSGLVWSGLGWAIGSFVSSGYIARRRFVTHI